MSDATAGTPNLWKKCSSCKQPIAFDVEYQRCSVSSCNHQRSGLVFCSVSCWSAHVPVYRHRDAWAIEERSPTRAQFLMQEKAAPSSNAAADSPSASPAGLASRPTGPAARVSPVAYASVANARPATVESSSSAGAPLSAAPDEVLVVVSKLKAYVKARGDMNTAGEVMDTLSDKLRRLCDDAIRRARQDGRKTLMSRDF